MDTAKVTSSVTFPANPSHATNVGGTDVVTSYQLIVWQQATGQAVFPRDLGKPTPNASNIITAPIGWTAAQFNALPAGTYTMTVSAIGPGGAVASPQSDPFGVVPAPAVQGKPSLVP